VKVSTNKKIIKHLSLKKIKTQDISLSFDDSKYKNGRAPFAKYCSTIDIFKNLFCPKFFFIKNMTYLEKLMNL
jgi:hypothetical protein